MLIGYLNGRISKACQNKKDARKSFPQAVADRLFQRLSELAAFENLGEIPKGVPPLKFHALTANLAGHYAIWVTEKYRVVFKPVGDFQLLIDGTPALDEVTDIEIVAVEDYHSGAN